LYVWTTKLFFKQNTFDFFQYRKTIGATNPFFFNAGGGGLLLFFFFHALLSHPHSWQGINDFSLNLSISQFISLFTLSCLSLCISHLNLLFVLIFSVDLLFFPIFLIFLDVSTCIFVMSNVCYAPLYPFSILVFSSLYFFS